MIVHYPLRLSHIFSRDRLFDRAPRLLPGKVHAEASPARTADIRVHPHRAADSSGGPRDLWPHREVTQRLIYFTVDRFTFLVSSVENAHPPCLASDPRRAQQPTLCRVHERSAVFTRGYIVFT